IAMAPVPLVVLISQRYGRRARPAIQEVQQRIAELTADAEENISGVRVVKSFAREPLQLRRFRGSVGRVFNQAMVATRLEATYNPIIAFLPQLGLAAVLLIGGRRVIHAHLSLGQFSAFYLYLNMLISPMRSLGVTLGLAQRATASGARIFQLLDRKPRMTVAAGAPPLPPGNGHVELRGVTLRYEASPQLNGRLPVSRASAAHPAGAASGCCRGERQPVSVLGGGRREHRLRAARWEPRGGGGRCAARAGLGVHRAPAAWAADARGRARPEPLRRAATAGGNRARVAGRSARVDSRRCDVIGGLLDREAH